MATKLGVKSLLAAPAATVAVVGNVPVTVTATVADLLTPLNVSDTVTVALPAPMPVTRPAEETTATAALDEEKV